MQKKVLFYMEKSSLAPKGGPAAIGYYYLNEKIKRSDSVINFIEPKNANPQRVESMIDHLPSFLKNMVNDLRIIRGFYQLLYGKSKKPLVNFNNYDIIHFHSTRNLFQVRDSLRDYKGKVILTSHSPVPYALELIDKLPSKYRWMFPGLEKRLEYMDEYSFKRADYIMFPCPQAEESYMSNWDKYPGIKQSKTDSYRYVLTGIPQAVAQRNRNDVLKELGIPQNSFVVNYVGRHNTLKGYDKLRIIGENLLNKYEDTWVVVAGTESPLKRYKHDRWHEVGWTNQPHSYINAADVFVLPNKETFFDIVMLEVLSLGTIVVASRTGGNKYFEGSKGVFLYDSIQEAIDIIEQIKHIKPEDREMLRENNKKLYSRMFTVKHMYDQYLNMIRDLK